MSDNTPRKDALAAHFIDNNHHTPLTDGVIESSVGERSGEAFQGRCVQGDGVASADASSFVTGTMTVKVGWLKDNLGEVDANSLTYDQYADEVEPTINLATEVNDTTKVITFRNLYRYHNLWIFDNGTLVGKYNLEEGNGNTLYDRSGNGNHLTVSNATVDFRQPDSDVPYSYLNEKGYNSLAGVELRESFGVTYTPNGNVNTGTVTNPNGRIIFFSHSAVGGVIDYPGQLTQHGWVNGEYLITSDFSANGSILFSLSGSYSLALIELEFFKYSSDITLDYRETRRWNEFRDRYLLEGYNLDSLSGGDMIKAITGVGGVDDNYPDTTLGFVGLTSTEIRGWLNDILHDASQYSSDLWNDYVAGGSTWNSNASYILTPMVQGHSFYSAPSNSLVKVSVVAANIPWKANLANAPGGTYFANNPNEPPVRINTLIFRHNASIPDFRFSKIKVVDLPIVSAQSRTLDALGNPLENVGKVKLQAQLKESWCLIGDGIWSTDVGVPITSVHRGVEDITSQCGVSGNTITPDVDLELYDITFNNDPSLYYMCAEGIDYGAKIAKIDGTGELTLNNFTPATDWGLQDVFHGNAYYGVFYTAGNNPEYTTYPIDGTSVRVEGFKRKRELNYYVESTFAFPDVPEIRAANIDRPELPYTTGDLLFRLPSTFKENTNDGISKMLVYNRVIPGNFPCYNLVAGQTIPFTTIAGWDSLFHYGTATIIINGSGIECTSDGTLYDLKALDVNGEVVDWFPVCEESGTSIRSVVSTNEGTLPTSDNWDLTGGNKDFDYVGIYGGRDNEAISIVQNDPTPGSPPDSVVVNRVGSVVSNNVEINNLQLNVAETQLDLDPDGLPQGWTTINGDLVFNQYCNTNITGVDYQTQFNLVSSVAVAASDVEIKVERMPLRDTGATHVNITQLEFQDQFQYEDFAARMEAAEAGSIAKMVTEQNMWECLNGGSNQGGALPNGIDDNFPATLGISLTSTQIRGIMDQIWKENGTTPIFMQSILDDSIDPNYTSWRFSLIRLGIIPLTVATGMNDITLLAENILATRGLSSRYTSFYSTYERTLQEFTNTVLKASNGAANETWFRWHKFRVKEIVGQKPAKYIGRLKRSSQTTENEEVDNIEELKTISDTAFKAMSKTKSEL